MAKYDLNIASANLRLALGLKIHDEHKKYKNTNSIKKITIKELIVKRLF